MSAAPGRLHQRAAFRLARLLDDACPPEFEVLPTPCAVGLAEDTELQPDIAVEREADLTDRDLLAAPALAVEVLSHSTKLIDLNVKKERLAAETRLIAWQLTPDGEYRQVADVAGDEAFEATAPFPVRVVPADLVRWPPVT